MNEQLVFCCTVLPKVIQFGKCLFPSGMWFSCTAVLRCNDLRFFNRYLCTPSSGTFQLNIFLHCISPFLVWLQLFLYCLHSQFFFQRLSILVMFFSYTPDVTPKFDMIFRIWDNSVTLFFSIQFCVYLFLVDLK